MTSTTRNNSKANRPIWRVAAVLLALLGWQAAAMLLSSRLLLASPIDVALRLCTIWREPGFFSSIWFSFSRIVGGFLLGLCGGVLLAVPAGRFPLIEALLRPLMVTVKSVPVASFIILALIWLSSAGLSVFIAFLMVLPIIYNGVLNGLHAADPKMLEAASVFRVPAGRRLLYIHLPQIYPFLFSSCTVALGLCWKAGVAAEVIGVPRGSIGEALYNAKIYLNTVDLFAWTVLIVLLSIGFEKLFLLLLKGLRKGLERL